jgi:hypothetical protein
MQTVTLQIKENRLEQFLKIIDGLKQDIVEECIVSTDEEYYNLLQFYKDKEMLSSRLADIQAGKAMLLDSEQYKEKMDKYKILLDQKHAGC